MGEPLRAAAGRDPHDRLLSELVGELSMRSTEFRTRWAAHDVRIHTSGVKLMHHPVVGDLDLPYESFPLPADTGLSLVTYARAGVALSRSTRPAGDLGDAERCCRSGAGGPGSLSRGGTCQSPFRRALPARSDPRSTSIMNKRIFAITTLAVALAAAACGPDTRQPSRGDRHRRGCRCGACQCRWLCAQAVVADLPTDRTHLWTARHGRTLGHRGDRRRPARFASAGPPVMRAPIDGQASMARHRSAARVRLSGCSARDRSAAEPSDRVRKDGQPASACGGRREVVSRGAAAYSPLATRRTRPWRGNCPVVVATNAGAAQHYRARLRHARGGHCYNSTAPPLVRPSRGASSRFCNSSAIRRTSQSRGASDTSAEPRLPFSS